MKQMNFMNQLLRIKNRVGFQCVAIVGILTNIASRTVLREMPTSFNVSSGPTMKRTRSKPRKSTIGIRRRLRNSETRKNKLLNTFRTNHHPLPTQS